MASEQHGYEPVSLTDRLLSYYRDVVAMHADDPVIGACLVCRVPRCEDWRFASERLFAPAAREAEPIIPAPPQPQYGADAS
ncbi:hypothetical protein EDD30_0879 [Couchioplanes caeruleus]|uniref:Uncharacterized protein n=2 Tax=Couchioplanes caeruleus TaxID=56438 RepID=A0A1K0GEZ5_9ACTN|nr:hypothetical protein BG844_30185 [Couchioplanes caeruleus subsp. caeruleus]ROP28169.1 hypothetical protein EDD30_0879 [Couchioplanes caeruleus]